MSLYPLHEVTEEQEPDLHRHVWVGGRVWHVRGCRYVCQCVCVCAWEQNGGGGGRSGQGEEIEGKKGEENGRGEAL